jgi:hypothetical protein
MFGGRNAAELGKQMSSTSRDLIFFKKHKTGTLNNMYMVREGM